MVVTSHLAQLWSPELLDLPLPIVIAGFLYGNCYSNKGAPRRKYGRHKDIQLGVIKKKIMCGCPRIPAIHPVRLIYQTLNMEKCQLMV
jgi:hypothetical protein